MRRRSLLRRLVPAALCVTVTLLSGCAVPIAAGLEEADANRVVVALDHAGIDASKEADPGVEGHFRVTVARDEATRALATMADEQLPRAKARGVLDSADRGQLVPSHAAEHAQLVVGLAGELERTLGGIEGVLAARVHLNLPRVTRSATVRHRRRPRAFSSSTEERTPPLTMESIQRLVAGGAPGLSPVDVAVVFVPRATRPAGGRPDVAHVGPITVARGSMNTLRAALAGLVLVVLALAGATLALYARVARLRREQETGGAARGPSPRAALAMSAPTSARPPGPHP